MPKHKLEIRVFTERGDAHGDQVWYAWFNKCGEHKSSRGHDNSDLKAQGYYLGVQPSDFQAIYTKLNYLINSGDAKGFHKLLKRQFIYDGKLSSRYTDTRSTPEYVITDYETYYAKPIIEVLFFEHNNCFSDLVDVLLKKNSPDFYQAVIDSLSNTDLSADRLFSWDETVKNNILKEVRALQDYSSDNLERGDEKAKERSAQVKMLTTSLSDLVAQAPASELKEETAHSKFSNLQFKLKVLKQLHSKDTDFAIHRSFKRYLNNVISFLFTENVLDSLKRAITFFKTTTENKISNIQMAAGLHPQDKIEFKN